ncbi:MAG: hypothetical protein IPO79_00440 [Flavobacteriales bacterium]|nr:hypothetical protein [Flavobacteriales bacterium]
MCTLTYLPHPGGFVMASSRDESRYRGGMGLPVQDTTLRACYPVDERSGGTWILTSADGYSLNLLNGGHRAASARRTLPTQPRACAPALRQGRRAPIVP